MQPSGAIIACAFVAATFAAFSSIYCSDSIAPLISYLKPIMNLSDTMVGWMSSVVYLPSLFMGVLLSGLIDKLGPIISGVLVNCFNILVGVLLPYSYGNQYLFLVARFLSGVVDEPSWITQSMIINRYIP